MIIKLAKMATFVFIDRIFGGPCRKILHWVGSNAVNAVLFKQKGFVRVVQEDPLPPT
jgi:hypothetical protein